MTILAVRDGIADYYRSTLPDVDVQTHGGPLTIEDIEEIDVKSPALIVSCLGVPRMDKQGMEVSVWPVFGVYILTEGNNKSDRDAHALLLTEAVMVELLQNRWPDGETGEDIACGPPLRPIATNLFSTDLDRGGVSMWVARWEQQVDLLRNNERTFTENLADLKTVFTTYDIGSVSDDDNTETKVELNET